MDDLEDTLGFQIFIDGRCSSVLFPMISCFAHRNRRADPLVRRPILICFFAYDVLHTKFVRNFHKFL